MEEPSLPSYDNVAAMLDDNGKDDESRMEVDESPKLVFKVSHEAKLKELLHNINAIEIKLCSDATKEFIKLLRGDSGGELLCLYVKASANFSELLQAWKLRQGKPGLSYVFSLISVIFSHPVGLYKPNDKERVGVSRVIDKFARLIIDEKMDDIYKELNSKEGKRQNAALTLMASIVRRGSGLASEVAKSFDFKLQSFSKIAEYKPKRGEKKRKHLTRKSVIGFAMSFLEVGKPGLLRWILQQKEMYSGVLRGLGDDEDEIVIYVLSTLRDRVLIGESLVPPGLRSVLFGSVVLEQLASILGRGDGGPAAELAYDVLLMVCTDSCNGLMPDLKRYPPLRGNPKRLLGLMKKLKGNEISYHRDLLMAILRGRPSLGSAYMLEFPYNVEDFASPTWFSNVSLAGSLLSSIGAGLSFDFLDSQTHDPPAFNNANVQNILNCICPRPFSRSVINKGLLHSDSLVKHGILRLLLEALKLFDSFISALNHVTCFSNQVKQSLASLKQELQNEVQMLLPDPQVLLSILSLKSSIEKTRVPHSKRKAETENLPRQSKKGIKKPKRDVVIEDSDIVVGGMSSAPQIAPLQESGGVAGALTVDELKPEKDYMNVVSEIWGSDVSPRPSMTLSDADSYFQSKLLHALKIYLRTMPTLLEGSFDFFVNLLGDALALPTNLQCSLLSLLTEYLGLSTTSETPTRIPPSMYKHMQPFINLLILSPVDEIKDQAYTLARAAMLSTGAFDKNRYEIGTWFLFLPGYSKTKGSIDVDGIAALQSLFQAVITFLCDAISTIGNSLFRYWAIIQNHADNLKEVKDASPDFSPLVICVLQKCLRLLSSESGTFSLPEKSMISLYVCNTLKYLLQSQVDVVFLSSLIKSILSEGLVDRCSVDDESEDILSEWRPLKNLLLFSRRVSDQQTCCIFKIDKKTMSGYNSFQDILSEVKNFVRTGHGVEVAGIIKAFSSAMLCATPDELLKSFPPVMTISQKLLGVPVSFLLSIMFLDQSFLARVSKLWPEVFFRGLEMALSMIPNGVEEENVHEIPAHSLFTDKMLDGVDFDATESGPAAFSYFLKQAPFHVLFPAIMSIDGPYLSEPSKIQDLLLVKLSELTSDCLVLNMRLVLFWLYQIQALCRIKPVADLQQLSEICLILVKHIFTQLLALKSHYSVEIVQGIMESVFCHPAAFASLTRPLSSSKDLTGRNLGNSLESFLSLSRLSVHKVDHHVLVMLVTTCDYLLTPCTDKCSILEHGANKRTMKAFNFMVQKLFLELRDKFNQCIRSKDVLPFIPIFYALHTLTRFISPFDLLELVSWMLCRVGRNEQLGCLSHDVSVLSIALCIAAGAFEALSTYLQQSITKRVTYDFLWQLEEKSFDVKLIEEVYTEVCKFSMSFDSEFSDTCLLKAINAMYHEKYVQQHSLHPLSMVMSRVMLRTPVEMICHCFNKANRTKARFLLINTKMSSMHLSIFGNLLSGFLDKDLRKGNHMGSCGCAVSDEGFIMLLPVALSYLNSNIVKFKKQYHRHFTDIPSFYSRMLLDGFRNWKSFVSRDIFQEKYSKLFPSSMEELLSVFDDSLLGKAVNMLHYHFALSKDLLEKEKLLELFYCIFPCTGTHNKLIDGDLSQMKFNSVNQSLNLINRIIAKISLSKLLLFPEDNQVVSLPKETDDGFKEMSLDSGSDLEDSSRMRFMNVLVNTWQLMAKKLPLIPEVSRKGKSVICLSLYKHLEQFLLRTIHELSERMVNDLIQLKSVPFLEQMMRSSLLYRFEDLTTLEILRSIFDLLLQGNCSSVKYLQLLIAHSQFASSIHAVSGPSNSGTGVFQRHMSSILRLVVTLRSGPNVIDGKRNAETTEVRKKQLEILKLLRALIQFKPQSSGSDFGEDSGINLGELYSLLLSSYGATLSYTDLEIYHLMREIELIDGSVCDLAKWDYLWGSAALKIRKERALDQHTSSDIMNDTESLKERRKSQFRENLPLEPKLCARTVLYFPYDRTDGDEPSSSSNLQAESHPPDGEDIKRYDPVFILRFSIYCLSMGYIEPAEFAGLGLLAVAFVSVSSPDVGMRKLGYETLGRFKNALETCQKKKEVTRLRLLLTYVQNGIEEPWQRIPSFIAVFAAEASLLLLDPSQDHFLAISKLLTRSHRVNMKSLPLFQNFFWSSSVNFRTERLWILRLAYAGLNLEDDAHIYMRSNILETLLSFYASPVSDNESRELILMIVKKSVKLHKLACYLVEYCGLISWLSSLLPISSELPLGDQKRFYVTQLAATVEVVNNVLSSRNIAEWLQKFALEQLMEFSCHLYRLLVGDVKLITEDISLVNSILQILVSTMKISQKRKMFQPHFTLSLEALFRLYKAVNVDNTAGASANSELGLNAILMSIPSVGILYLHHEKLLSFLTWAVSTALKSDSQQMTKIRDSSPHLSYSSEESLLEESLASKLLRWLTASVILGKLTRKSKLSKISQAKTLQSLMDNVEKGCEGTSESRSDCEEILATAIYYLQQSLGVYCRVIPSVVLALSLLLFWDGAKYAGSDFEVQRTLLSSLLSRIHCPAEANPSWRWSFYQPWKDHSSNLTDVEEMDELHACQILLVTISNVLDKKSLDSRVLSCEDGELSNVFEREKTILLSE